MPLVLGEYPARQAESDNNALRRALVVGGMHRSGTSALARVLNLLGADLPKAVLDPKSYVGNASGFWEPQRVVELNEKLLSEAGRSWHDIAAIPNEWFESGLVRSYTAKLAAVIREEYQRLDALRG